MNINNITPWIVEVYSGFSHWDKLIDELTEVFCTKEAAITYSNVIKHFNPNYRIEIYKSK